jgi:trk system potassium uptake protein TrkA
MKMGKKNLYIIIIGCGKLGAFLANEFSKIGDSVVVIDKNGRKFSKLSVDFSGFRIEEDALDEDILIEAKIDQADVLICASNDDDTNIMIALIAKRIYETPVVISRLYEPTKTEFLEKHDVKVISPLHLSVQEYKQIINGYRGK